MKTNAKELVGKKIGFLTPLKYESRRKGDRYRVYLWCLCDCGNKTWVLIDNLRRGHTVSCGCKKGKHGPQENLIGHKFGRWTVIELGASSSRKQTKWICQCECGTIKEVFQISLKRGTSLSCDCLKREFAGKQFLTHGNSINRKVTREYSSWRQAKGRCHNPRHKQYKDYGGRGIYMCEEWLNDFSQFLEDMGPCPEGMSLHRIDNDGSYTLKNTKWADDEEQANNKRNSVYLKYDERKLTIPQWSKIIGISIGAIRARKRRGWSDEEALTLSPYQKRIK